MTTGLLIAAAAALIAGGALRWLRRRWLLVRVRGDSMRPALWHGDLVLARRCRIGTVSTGDVVVFGWPPPDHPAPAGRSRTQEWVVKRVAAVPGEPVPAVVEPAAAGVTPPGCLIVLGDNGGLDSRTFGLLAARQLLAVMVRRVGPANVEPDQGPDPGFTPETRTWPTGT